MVPDGVADGLGGVRARLHGDCGKRVGVGVAQSGIGIAAMSASGGCGRSTKADRAAAIDPLLPFDFRARMVGTRRVLNFRSRKV